MTDYPRRPVESAPSVGRGCPCHLAGRSLPASCLQLARWKPSFGILPADGFQRRRDSTGNPSRDPHLAWRPVTPRRSVTLVGPSRRDGLSRAARGWANRGSWAKHNRPGGHLTARGGRGAGACSTSVGDFAPLGKDPLASPTRNIPARRHDPPAAGPTAEAQRNTTNRVATSQPTGGRGRGVLDERWRFRPL